MGAVGEVFEDMQHNSKTGKKYTKPVLKSQKMELGVFGDYGGDDGTDDPIKPIGDVERFRLRME